MAAKTAWFQTEKSTTVRTEKVPPPLGAVRVGLRVGGLGHSRILRDETVLQTVVSFVHESQKGRTS